MKPETLFEYTKRSTIMKTMITYILICCFILSGCAGSLSASRGVNYIYHYSLVQPPGADMIFRDDYIYIQFKIDESAINFQLQNISGASLSILWEKVSMGVNKRIFAVRNSSTLYSASTASPVTVVIPPLGYVRETVIPRENIFFRGGEWREKLLFRTNDRGSQKLRDGIKRMVGSEVTLTLPLKIGEVEVKYPFVFRIASVEPLPSNVLPPAKDRPMPPKTPVQESSVGPSYVPILIAAVIFGVSAYFLSKKERSPSDL